VYDHKPLFLQTVTA